MAAGTLPLTLGEILDRTVQIYRRNFLLFLGISILPSAIYVSISGGLGLYYSSRLGGVQAGVAPTPTDMLTVATAAVVFLLIGMPLLIGVSAASLGALNFAAVWTDRGETATIRNAYAQGLRRFWRYVGILFLQILFAFIIPAAALSVLVFAAAIIAALTSRGGGGPALAVVVGLFMLLVFFATMAVCFWIWLRFCLAFPASAVENKKAWPSLQRSAQLSKGTRGRIFVMYLLVVILTLVAYYALTLPIDIVLKLTMYKSMAAIALLTKPPIVLQIVNLVINCLERAFVLPIYSIALVLFYNDQRTRMEGYDIEQLMDRAGWSALPAAPPVFASSPAEPPPAYFPPPASFIPVDPPPDPPANPFHDPRTDPANPNPEGTGA
jgi:membrane-anchored glycerophosphoryl diester phosphodiesterase (GDPDase)